MKEDSFKAKGFQISKHKVIEFQISRWKDAQMFDFDYWVRQKQDHPGFSLEVTLFHHEFMVDFYDTRHWDRAKDDFEVPPPAPKKKKKKKVRL